VKGGMIMKLAAAMLFRPAAVAMGLRGTMLPGNRAHSLNSNTSNTTMGHGYHRGLRSLSAAQTKRNARKSRNRLRARGQYRKAVR